MSADASKSKDLYWLEASFEKTVALLCCTSPKFLLRVGNEIDVDCLNLEPCRLAIGAAQAMAKVEGGRPPAAMAVVLQRLRNDGKTKISSIAEVAEMLDEASDFKVDEEGTVEQLAKILRERIARGVGLLAFEDAKNKRDFAATIAAIEKVKNLGVERNDLAEVLASPASVAAIAEISQLERLSTSILELDDACGGGLRRGCLGIHIGGPGDGKSMALSQQAAFASLRGFFVVYATLELPRPDVIARIAAAMLRVEIDAVLAHPAPHISRITNMKRGPIVVQDFTPGATTFAQLETWVDAAERRHGRKVDLLITDYGDKLVAPGSSNVKRDDGGYHRGLEVFERMRVFAHERNLWHWTASQARRRQKNQKVLSIDDVADSMHKVRVADLVTTLNVHEDEQVIFHVVKNRFGRGKTQTSLLPTDFPHGQIAPMVDADLGDAIDQRRAWVDVAGSGEELGG